MEKRQTKRPRRPLRRALLASLGLAMLAAPALASGCGADFDPISDILSLRVLAVEVTQEPAFVVCPSCRARGGSYANPGDTVRFHMDFYDGYVNLDDPGAGPRNVQVTWLGGCFNPTGDEYYACYPQIASLFQSIGPGQIMNSGLVGTGPYFDLTLPDDLISSRPKPSDGAPRYGIAYVFFAACAGKLAPVPATGDGAAGSFPLGCFDGEGNQLGADSFVPGYTQVYAFEDGRTNENPVVYGFTINGNKIEEGPANAPKVQACKIAEDQRSAQGCGKVDPYTTCGSYALDVVVPDDVAEVDPGGTSSDGKPLHEAVWVDYFVEKGDVDADTLLVSDATLGIQHHHGTDWIAPPEPGLVTLWAVVHDARGGETLVQRYVRVE